MSLPFAVPEVRFSSLVSVHYECVHWRGELGSTSCADGCAVAVLVVLLVNWCNSRTVVANFRPVGGGTRVRAGVDGRVRVDFVFC